jgi:PEGA domain
MIKNFAWCVERGRAALRAKVRRSSLSLLAARNAAWRIERRWPVAIGHLRRSWLGRHVAEAMANLRIPKTSVPITYVAVATVFTALALMSAFVLHSVGRASDLVGPPVVRPTAPVPSTAMPVLPSATSATTSSEGSLDSATTVQRYASARQVASAEFETPATPRATEFVGTLSIRSTPDKAEVHIDRERVGETPLVLRRVRAGSHAIWIEHEGYQRWTAGVNVAADERTQVTVTLQAEPGR